MKKLLLFVLFFLNFNIYALANSSQSSRTYTPTFRHWYKPFYNSANFREKIAYNIYKGMDVSNNNGPKYASTSTASSQFRGSTGATSSGTVSGTVTKTIPKQTVFQKVFQNGKNAAVAARKLGTRALPFAGWALTAYEIYDFLARKEGYDIECEEGLCRAVNGTVVVFNTKNATSLVEGRTYTYAEFQKWCNQNSCFNPTFVDNPTYEQLNEIKMSKCSGVQVGGKQADRINEHRWCTRDGYYGGNIGVGAYRISDTVPFTEEEFNRVAEAAADAAIEKWIEATGGNLEWSEPKIHILAGQVAQSDPYTNPTTNQPEQAKWKFSNDAQGNTIVEETIIPRPDLKPNSPEAPKVETPTTTDTPTNNDPKRQTTETQDLCEKNPDILACDKQPEAPTASAPLSIPEETIDLSFQPDSIFPTDGVCPAPVSFQISIPFSGSKTFAFDTAPMCDTANRLRGFVIALAWLAATSIALFAVRNT
ncbi:MAG: IgG-binding virulence factor TspB family protein [Alysiella sp.]|uniref:IgG-binding virulence factor TspB family protein n=1 Tax=Alysiella sp. TaxID=1872483 RepID=UPI0026DC7676|nr:IgG-binding virulence factor TspB family protein [Alysiella sp.]MDO4433722.1 IgG-binding virulence factor TspB family protein [Alysiella sp.]